MISPLSHSLSSFFHHQTLPPLHPPPRPLSPNPTVLSPVLHHNWLRNLFLHHKLTPPLPNVLVGNPLAVLHKSCLPKPLEPHQPLLPPLAGANVFPAGEYPNPPNLLIWNLNPEQLRRNITLAAHRPLYHILSPIPHPPTKTFPLHLHLHLAAAAALPVLLQGRPAHLSPEPFPPPLPLMVLRWPLLIRMRLNASHCLLRHLPKLFPPRLCQRPLTTTLWSHLFHRPHRNLWTLIYLLLCRLHRLPPIEKPAIGLLQTWPVISWNENIFQVRFFHGGVKRLLGITSSSRLVTVV